MKGLLHKALASGVQGISPGYPGLTCLPSVACPASGSGGPSGQPPPRRRIGSPRSFVALRLWNHAYALPWRFSAYRRLSTAAVYPKSSLSRGRQPPGIYLIRNLAKRIPRVVRKLREGKRKPPEESGGKRKSRRLPIFPGRFQPSILGASGLNCRVRDGNGCTPTAIGTDYIQGKSPEN